MSESLKLPAYCLHKPSGQAFVRFGRTPHYLGAFDSDESRQMYDQLIAEFLANGRSVGAEE